MAPAGTVEPLVQAARELSRAVSKLRFGAPVTHVYNPLEYAWAAHEEYLRRFGMPPKRVVFLGMNPGPFGMVQTGIPFGEISAVRHWMGIRAPIGKPAAEHTRRPVLGYDCARSEVSGARLWKLFADRFGSAENFFRDHFVINYCPLAFLEESGCNRTPDKLPARQAARLFQLCDTQLRTAIQVLRPVWIIAIGGFAERAAYRAGSGLTISILHPSPASPAANRDWAGTVTRRLKELGVFARQSK